MTNKIIGYGILATLVLCLVVFFVGYTGWLAYVLSAGIWIFGILAGLRLLNVEKTRNEKRSIENEVSYL